MYGDSKPSDLPSSKNFGVCVYGNSEADLVTTGDMYVGSAPGKTGLKRHVGQRFSRCVVVGIESCAQRRRSKSR